METGFGIRIGSANTRAAARRSRGPRRDRSSAMVMFLTMLLVLAESSIAHGRVLASENTQKVADHGTPKDIKSARASSSHGYEHRERNKVVVNERVFTLASGPSRRGSGH